MKSDHQMPSSNVIPFPGPGPGDCHSAAASTADGEHRFDHGPAPEESLRLMRAFMGIKNKMLRADLVNMLEGAARARGPESARGKE
jgi:hypothetical protein